MKVFEYSIYLLDPLFYAREGLSAAFTPPYLHATAINFAMTATLGINPEGQPYVVSEDNGGRNTPRYKNSLASDKFYFTPARLASPLKYFPEWTKGENDGFTAQTKMGEVLKAEILNYLPPETQFKGFLISNEGIDFPDLIRLGTFRGKARLVLEELKFIKSVEKEQTASHPVDPLLSEVSRGFMVNMFPYPIVENATTKHGVEVRNRKERFSKVVALPDNWEKSAIEVIKSDSSSIIV